MKPKSNEKGGLGHKEKNEREQFEGWEATEKKKF